MICICGKDMWVEMAPIVGKVYLCSCGEMKYASNLAKPDVKPTLSEVLARLEKESMNIGFQNLVHMDDIKKILSEYFA